MTKLTNKKLLNLQEEFFMKKFIEKITHTAKSAVTCVKTAVGNSMSAVLAFNLLQHVDYAPVIDRKSTRLNSSH